jgi:hypothetical protein
LDAVVTEARAWSPLPVTLSEAPSADVASTCASSCWMQVTTTLSSRHLSNTATY